jgi:hypothetical protein
MAPEGLSAQLIDQPMTVLLGRLPANQFETFIVIGGGEDMRSSRVWRMVVLKVSIRRWPPGVGMIERA